MSTAETELVERLKRQANTDAWQANVQEVERQTCERQKVAGVLGAPFGDLHEFRVKDAKLVGSDKCMRNLDCRVRRAEVMIGGLRGRGPVRKTLLRGGGRWSSHECVAAGTNV